MNSFSIILSTSTQDQTAHLLSTKIIQSSTADRLTLNPLFFPISKTNLLIACQIKLPIMSLYISTLQS